MRKKTLSLSFLAIAFSIFGGYAMADAPLAIQRLATTAITNAKKNVSYSQVNLGNSLVYKFTSSDLSSIESTFKAKINSTWNSNSTIFLKDLASRNYDQNNIMNMTVSTYNAKQIAFATQYDRLYDSFLVAWKNSGRTNTITEGLTNIASYTTLGGKVYTIYKSASNKYYYNDSDSMAFTNLPALYNYIEFRNRLMYISPNGKRYGIFKRDGNYYYMRLEWNGSNYYYTYLSARGRNTLSAVKSYINYYNPAGDSYYYDDDYYYEDTNYPTNSGSCIYVIPGICVK